jgi:hypothetical protein
MLKNMENFGYESMRENSSNFILIMQSQLFHMNQKENFWWKVWKSRTKYEEMCFLQVMSRYWSNENNKVQI